MSKLIYILAPHPDDETLACGGTIQNYIQNGYTVEIIVISDGENSHNHLIEMNEEMLVSLKRIRREECIAACATLGVSHEQVHFLGIPDGEAEKQSDKITTYLKHKLENPYAIYLPHIQDKHPDHIALAKIVLKFFKTNKLRAELYLYKVYDLNVDLKDYQNPTFFIQDISSFLEQKKKALSCYQSQFTLFFPSQTKPVLSDAFWKKHGEVGFEVFQRI
jgi:LmbE family N-acetylglucosaminyl deacetylase